MAHLWNTDTGNPRTANTEELCAQALQAEERRDQSIDIFEAVVERHQTTRGSGLMPVAREGTNRGDNFRGNLHNPAPVLLFAFPDTWRAKPMLRVTVVTARGVTGAALGKLAGPELGGIVLILIVETIATLEEFLHVVVIIRVIIFPRGPRLAESPDHPVLFVLESRYKFFPFMQVEPLLKR